MPGLTAPHLLREGVFSKDYKWLNRPFALQKPGSASRSGCERLPATHPAPGYRLSGHAVTLHTHSQYMFGCYRLPLWQRFQSEGNELSSSEEELQRFSLRSTLQQQPDKGHAALLWQNPRSSYPARKLLEQPGPSTIHGKRDRGRRGHRKQEQQTNGLGQGAALN